jgi:hypothetical protein
MTPFTDSTMRGETKRSTVGAGNPSILAVLFCHHAAGLENPGASSSADDAAAAMLSARNAGMTVGYLFLIFAETAAV